MAIVWGFPFWIKAQFTEDFICIDSANLVIMYKLEYKSDSTMVKGHYEEKMILKIADTRNHYNFQMISIERPLERVVIGNSNETSQKLAKGMQSKNNPLELDGKRRLHLVLHRHFLADGVGV